MLIAFFVVFSFGLSFAYFTSSARAGASFSFAKLETLVSMNNGTYANSGNVVLTQENINTESAVKVCESAKVKTTAESIDSYLRVKVSYKPIGANANNDFVTSVIVALNSDLNNYITTVADTQNGYGWFYNENDKFYYLSTLDSAGNPTQTLKECNSNVEYNILSSVIMSEIAKYNLGIDVKSIPSNSVALCVDAQAVQKEHLNLSTANNVGELSELISKANKNNSLFNDIITDYGNIVRFNTVSNALKIPTSITTNINAVEFTLPQVDGVDVDWYDSYLSGQYGVKVGTSGDKISKATIESKGDMVLYAKYSTDTITFAFESDGADSGVVPANITTTYGDGKTQVVVNTLEKYGYECVSWVVKGDSTKVFPISTTSIEINNNIGTKGSTVTFIPNWQAVTYTATFVMDENSSLDNPFTNLGSNVYSKEYKITDKFTFPLPTLTTDKVFKGFEVISRVENSRWRVKDIYTNGEMIKGNFGNVTFKIVYEESGSGSGTTTKTDIATLKDTMTIDGATQIVYDGTQKRPNVIVKSSSGKELTKGGDYELVYGENIKAGEGTIVVNGKNGYEGYVELRFTIEKRNISNANVSTLSDKTYTGKEITQDYTVSDVILNETKSLVADVDYQGVFSQNTNAGTAKLTIIGLGNYSGTKEVEFKINQLNISGATITLNNLNLVYNGTEQVQTIASVVATNKMEVTDYNISGNLQTYAGEYTLTVTGCGNFIGSATKTFQITKKALTITAKNQTVETGGSIQTGTNQIITTSLAGGDVVSSITLTQSSTTTNGTITPSNAVIKRGETTVTNNYNITFASGVLTVTKGKIYTITYVDEEEKPTTVHNISTAQDLVALATKVNSGNRCYTDVYVLKNDIDMSGIEWTPIGNTKQNYFCGEFNGCGYTIKNLTISNNTKYTAVGLFGYFNGDIRNTRLENLNINDNYATYVGGFVGYATNSHIGRGCYITNNVIYNATITSTKADCLGGIVGHNYDGGSVHVENNVVTANLSGGSSKGILSGKGYNSDFENNYAYDKNSNSTKYTGNGTDSSVEKYNNYKFNSSGLMRNGRLGGTTSLKEIYYENTLITYKGLAVYLSRGSYYTSSSTEKVYVIKASNTSTSTSAEEAREKAIKYCMDNGFPLGPRRLNGRPAYFDIVTRVTEEKTTGTIPTAGIYNIKDIEPFAKQEKGYSYYFAELMQGSGNETFLSRVGGNSVSLQKGTEQKITSYCDLVEGDNTFKFSNHIEVNSTKRKDITVEGTQEYISSDEITLDLPPIYDYSSNWPQYIIYESEDSNWNTNYLRKSETYTGKKGNITVLLDGGSVDFTITLDLQGGECGTTSVSCRYGSSARSIETPTKTGKFFEGYYTEPNGQGEKYFDYNGYWVSGKQYNVKGNSTFYANYVDPTYTITIDYQGGSGTVDKIYVNTTLGTSAQYSVSSIDYPTLAGHKFIGYYTNKNAVGTRLGWSDVKSIVSSLNTTSDVTIYACYEAPQYILTLDAQGGSGGTEKVEVYKDNGTAPSSLTEPSKYGYDFMGYYTGKDGTGTNCGNTMNAIVTNAPKYNTTLYAYWKLTKFTLKLTAKTNHGTISKTSVTADYGTSIEVIATNKIKIGSETITVTPDAGYRVGFSSYAYRYYHITEDSLTGNYNVYVYYFKYLEQLSFKPNTSTSDTRDLMVSASSTSISGEISIPEYVIKEGNYYFEALSDEYSKYTSNTYRITKIGNGNSTDPFGGAFSQCAQITKVFVPSSILEIEAYAFNGCTGMKNFSISSNADLKTIGVAAFASCSGLTSIDIPKNVTSVGDSRCSQPMYRVFNKCSDNLEINLYSKNSSSFNTYWCYNENGKLKVYNK